MIARAREARQGGDGEGALALYRAAADTTREPVELAHCLRHIGDLAAAAGDRDAARDSLTRAEQLYREAVGDALGLANTVRLRALLEDDPARWRDARDLYVLAAAEGWDLAAALAECDRHLR